MGAIKSAVFLPTTSSRAQRGISDRWHNQEILRYAIKQPAQWCAACGEGIISAEDNRAVIADIQEEKARIDGLLPPSEIQHIRKKLKLTQKAASDLFGGGINAFNRQK